MTGRFLLDTGPLVAFLNRGDAHHEWAKATLGAIPPPLLTCEAVISEACFLLRHVPEGWSAVLELLERGLVGIPFRLADELGPVSALMKRYASVPMSLADGCLVRMSEATSKSTVLTLDSDFKIYRRHGRLTVPTLMPPTG